MRTTSSEVARGMRHRIERCSRRNDRRVKAIEGDGARGAHLLRRPERQRAEKSSVYVAASADEHGRKDQRDGAGRGEMFPLDFRAAHQLRTKLRDIDDRESEGNLRR